MRGLGSAAVDLNGDGTDEALVKITHMYWCSGGMDACRIWVLQKTPAGAWDLLGYPYAEGVAVLDSSTNGFPRSLLRRRHLCEGRIRQLRPQGIAPASSPGRQAR